MKKQTNQERKTKKRGISGFIIFVLTIILCDAIVSGYFAPIIKNKIDKLGGGASGIVAFLIGHDEEKLKSLKPINILLIGESGVDAYKLADTIMICSYQPNADNLKESKASILSIPRDTYVGSYQNYVSASYKINTRYHSGEKMDTLINDIKTITGIEIDYYIRINTDALIKLVDLIGGVQFDVPMDMKYDDPTQNLHINLQKGPQLITGKKAEQLLRFRHSNNGQTYSYEYGQEDFGRMRTQREFIQATLQQTLKPENIDKINNLVEIGYDNIVTNIDLDKILDYVPYILDFQTENLKMDVLPGESKAIDGVWIFAHDKNKTKKLVQEMFFSDQSEEQ